MQRWMFTNCTAHIIFYYYYCTVLAAPRSLYKLSTLVFPPFNTVMVLNSAYLVMMLVVVRLLGNYVFRSRVAALYPTEFTRPPHKSDLVLQQPLSLTLDSGGKGKN